MARAFDQLLDVERGVAEGGLRLGCGAARRPRPCSASARTMRMPRPPPPAAGLDQHRVADGRSRRPAPHRRRPAPPSRARAARRPRAASRAALILSPMASMACGRGPDEHQTRRRRRPGRRRRARTGSRSPGAPRRSRCSRAAFTSAFDVQVALRRRCRADARLAAGQARRQAVDVGIGHRRHRLRRPAPGRRAPRAPRSLPRLATNTRRMPGMARQQGRSERRQSRGRSWRSARQRLWIAAFDTYDCQQSLSSDYHESSDADVGPHTEHKHMPRPAWFSPTSPARCGRSRCSVGDSVAEEQTLVILESMKMEIPVGAPRPPARCSRSW